MKNQCLHIATGLLFLLLTATVQAQPINWDGVRAAYVAKYQPQQVPAWLFPIIFEEGDGQRDTIYLGYDEGAKTWGIGGHDTAYGEKYYKIDTFKFNAYWNSMKKDSIYKVLVFPSPGGGGISFHTGTLPLKIYWDSEAFYSDSLPFADQDAAPRAQGELTSSNWYTYNPDGTKCYAIDPVLMSDTGVGAYDEGRCRHTDSLVFYSILGPGTISDDLTLVINPWKGYIPLGIKKTVADKAIKVYPNPADESVHIRSSEFIEHVNLFKANGKCINIITGAGHKYSLNTSALPQGLYLLRIATNNDTFTRKIIIQH